MFARMRSYYPGPGVLLGAVVSLVLGIAFLVLGDTVAEDGRVRADRWLALELHRLASVSWTRIMRLATDLGSAYVTVPLMLVLVGCLLWRHRRRTGGTVVAFWIGAQLIDLVTKPLYHRDRPSLFPAFARAGGYSFPSGHTVTAVLTYGLIGAVLVLGQTGWRRRLPIALAIVIIVAVATSRVYLGVHYPSDVLGGILIGGAWLQLAILVLAAVKRREKSSQPHRSRPSSPISPLPDEKQPSRTRCPGDGTPSSVGETPHSCSAVCGQAENPRTLSHDCGRRSRIWTHRSTIRVCASVGCFGAAGVLLDGRRLDCSIGGADRDRNVHGVRVGVVQAIVVDREVIDRSGIVEVGNSCSAGWDREAGGKFGVVAFGRVRRRIGERVIDLEACEFSRAGIRQGDFEVVANAFARGIDVVLDEN